MHSVLIINSVLNNCGISDDNQKSFVDLLGIYYFSDDKVSRI